VRPGLYVCGDHVDNASINGAMESGRRAAEAVLADRARG
jgi:predicted NAD/FAD-dependent oxidoreductase